MHITVFIYRTPSQMVQVSLRSWTVGGGSRDIAQVVWDPSGPLDARTAAMGSLERLLAHLAGAELVAGGPTEP